MPVSGIQTIPIRSPPQDEETRPVTIGEVPDIGLDDEGKKAAQSADETDLREGQGEPLCENGQERRDEGIVEITGKVDQCQGEDDPDVELR